MCWTKLWTVWAGGKRKGLSWSGLGTSFVVTFMCLPKCLPFIPGDETSDENVSRVSLKNLFRTLSHSCVIGLNKAAASSYFVLIGRYDSYLLSPLHVFHVTLEDESRVPSWLWTGHTPWIRVKKKEGKKRQHSPPDMTYWLGRGWIIDGVGPRRRHSRMSPVQVNSGCACNVRASPQDGEQHLAGGELTHTYT